MLTAGRNLDRNGQTITYLPYFDSCYTFLDHVSPSTVLLWLTLPLLLWFFSKLILIFSHLFSLYSDYSYLFLLKTNVDFTLWNPVPKVTFRNRRPTPRNKNKTIFIDIYTLECLCLWYMSDLVIWLSVMSCGVMSTITSAYAYRHK
jgi:hypothetical protein